MTTPTTNIAPKDESDGKRDLAVVRMLCLPAILGGLFLLPWLVMLVVSGVAGVAAVTRHSSLESVAASLFSVSLLLYWLSPLTTLAGVAYGWWTLRRRGLRTRNGKAIKIFLGLAVGSTVIFLLLATSFFSNLNLRLR